MTATRIRALDYDLDVAQQCISYLEAERDRLRDQLLTARDWNDRLSETLMAVNAQHGGRNAARLLKDFRDYRATLADTPRHPATNIGE